MREKPSILHPYLYYPGPGHHHLWFHVRQFKLWKIPLWSCPLPLGTTPPWELYPPTGIQDFLSDKG